MKIYFAGSIRAGRGDADLYQQIIGFLQIHGPVLTEHVGNLALSKHETLDHTSVDRAVYEQDMGWLKESDVVVAEVTTPSLGVGYEIAMAETLKKPVLCLYRPQPGKKLSSMVAGSPTVTVREYNQVSDVKKIFEEFVGVSV